MQLSELEAPKSMETERKVEKVFWAQRLASVTLSLVVLLIGLANGWSSPYLAQLKLKDNVDGIPRATDNELSWIASLINVGRIFGTVAGAVAQETIGRKNSLLVGGLPMLVGWICTAAATTIQWLYVARLFCGISMGMIWTTMSIYLAEIADPEIRGSLVLWNIACFSIGLFLGNLMGAYISMSTFAYVSLALNVLFLVLFPRMPESPYWHMMTGHLDKAEESFKWFHRKDEVQLELQEIQEYVNTSKTPLTDRLRELREPRYRSSFLLMVLMNVFRYFGAYNVIIHYMEIIITSSRVSMVPSTIVNVTGFFSIISGLLATFLVDRLGRRFLLLVSSLGMAVSLSCLGLHFRLLDQGYDGASLTWLPIACLLGFTISHNAGCSSIPNTLMGELFPPKLKTIASLFFSGSGAVSSSLSTGTFFTLLGIVRPDCLFLFYASGVYVSVLYYYFFLPETKGKSLKEIQIQMHL